MLFAAAGCGDERAGEEARVDMFDNMSAVCAAARSDEHDVAPERIDLPYSLQQERRAGNLTPDAASLWLIDLNNDGELDRVFRLAYVGQHQSNPAYEKVAFAVVFAGGQYAAAPEISLEHFVIGPGASRRFGSNEDYLDFDSLPRSLNAEWKAWAGIRSRIVGAPLTSDGETFLLDGRATWGPVGVNAGLMRIDDVTYIKATADNMLFVARYLENRMLDVECLEMPG